MDLNEEIDCGIRALQALRKLVPEGGPRNLERVKQEMDEMISPEFEPYFQQMLQSICWPSASGANGAAGRRTQLPSP